MKHANAYRPVIRGKEACAWCHRETATHKYRDGVAIIGQQCVFRFRVAKPDIAELHGKRERA